MPQKATTTTTSNGSGSRTPNPNDPAEYRKLVEQVAEKVWVLWREEMRRERERSARR